MLLSHGFKQHIVILSLYCLYHRELSFTPCSGRGLSIYHLKIYVVGFVLFFLFLLWYCIILDRSCKLYLLYTFRLRARNTFAPPPFPGGIFETIFFLKAQSLIATGEWHVYPKNKNIFQKQIKVTINWSPLQSISLFLLFYYIPSIKSTKSFPQTSK